MDSVPRWVWAVFAAKGDRHNIRQVVIMLCLICICELLLAVICPGEDCELNVKVHLLKALKKEREIFPEQSALETSWLLLMN